MVRRFNDYSQYMQHQSQIGEDNEIKSDFSLIFSLLKEFLLYLILLIPNLLGFVIYIFVDSYKAKLYLQKIFVEPFVIMQKILTWFFQAKITAYLIVFLIFIYLLEVIFLSSNPELFASLMTNPNHLLQGNYYSILTSVFLHADIVHLLSNCLALLIFGRIVEKQLRSKMLLVFLGSGVIANLVSHILSFVSGDLFSSLGASGAIAGLIMFAILLEPLALTSILFVPLPIFIIGWGLILLDVIGLTNPSNVNHFAHLGGYGALLILFFFLELRHRKKIILGFAINLTMILFFYLIIKIVGLEVIRNLIGV